MTANQTWLHRSAAFCIHCTRADIHMPSGGLMRAECLFFSGEVAAITCHPLLKPTGAAILVLFISVISALKAVLP